MSKEPEIDHAGGGFGSPDAHKEPEAESKPAPKPKPKD